MPSARLSPAPNSVFAQDVQPLADEFIHENVRAGLHSHLSQYITHLGPVIHTRAARRLQELVILTHLTPANANEIWNLVTVIELAIHEAAHLSGTYLFQQPKETQITRMLLPGHPELGGQPCALVRHKINHGHHSAVSLLAPLLCPEVTHSNFHFTVSSRRYETGSWLSDTDHQAIDEVLRSVREHRGDQELGQDDLTLARNMLQRHRQLIRQCSTEMAEGLVEAMWNGEHSVDPALLLRRLIPLANRGQYSFSGEHRLEDLAPHRPWWVIRLPWTRRT